MMEEDKKTKYIVLLGDGMGDRPVAELGNKTPLEAANTPNMDKLAREGMCGITGTLVDGYPMGSDVANLTVLGYDPRKYYTGRSPLEALGLDLEVGDYDMVFRANLVNIRGEGSLAECTMVDHSSDKITDAEAAELIETLAGEMPDYIKLYTGASYRNVLIWKDYLKSYKHELELAPPHDILEQSLADNMPKGNGAEILTEISEKSRKILQAHPVNIARAAKGLRMANCLWMWGDGTKPMLTGFKGKYGIEGVMITAVPLLEGLAAGTGMRRIRVPGVTSDINTNYEGKANAAIDALKEGAELAFVHIEAADECGHDGNAQEKKLSIEYIDRRALGVILSRIDEIDGEVRILLMPDHATPICARTHTADPIPFAIWSNKQELYPHAEAYNERSAQEGGFMIADGKSIMSKFIGR